MYVEISDEAISRVVHQELMHIYINLNEELEAAKAGHNTLIFSTDTDTEIKEIKKNIKAFRRVLGWYTVGGTLNG
jgi:hypothetical protein